MNARGRRRARVAVGAAFVWVTVGGALFTAEATAPGANGLLVCEGMRPDADGVQQFDVFTIKPDGTEETVLTTSPARDGDASWSPDGTRLAFESFRDDGSEVYVMNADGSDVTRLTFNGPTEDRGTKWSPDGSKLAFHSGRFGAAVGPNALEILTMNPDGTNPVRLTNNADQDSQPEWSPDSSKIVFTSNRDGDYEIYVMDADGSNPTRLTSSPGEDAHATWSPDGTKIAFHSRRDGLLNVFVMDADGSNVTLLTPGTELTSEFFPVWSPDGSKITFTGDTLAEGHFDAYTMDADGSDIVRLTTASGFDGRCDWQPDIAASAIGDCMNGRWSSYNTPANTQYRNQGECVSSVARPGPRP